MQRNPAKEILDPCFYSIYDSLEGFRFIFEGLLGINTNLHISAFCSFNPPGDYYTSNKSMENTFIFGIIDPESPINAPKYVNEGALLKSIDPQQCKEIIIDLYGISSEKNIPKLINLGWTILPLFHNTISGVYVNCGYYQVI